jgi:hypothetical protein
MKLFFGTWHRVAREGSKIPKKGWAGSWDLTDDARAFYQLANYSVHFQRFRTTAASQWSLPLARPNPD